MQVGGYTLRLPAGYREARPTGPMLSSRGSGATAVLYHGIQHPNGAAPTLGFAITTLSHDVPQARDGQGRDEALRGVLLRLSRRGLSLTQGKAQTVAIHGLMFEWAPFTLVIAVPEGTRTTHGAEYVSVHGRTFISIEALDSVPYSDQTLPVLEAAVQTFRRR